MAIYAAIGTQYFAQERRKDVPSGLEDHPFCDFFHAYYTVFGVVAYVAFPL